MTDGHKPRIAHLLADHREGLNQGFPCRIYVWGSEPQRKRRLERRGLCLGLCGSEPQTVHGCGARGDAAEFDQILGGDAQNLSAPVQLQRGTLAATVLPKIIPSVSGSAAPRPG